MPCTMIFCIPDKSIVVDKILQGGSASLEQPDKKGSDVGISVQYVPSCSFSQVVRKCLAHP